MFGLSIQNKSIAINTSLTFLFEFVELKEKHHIKKKYLLGVPNISTFAFVCKYVSIFEHIYVLEETYENISVGC